MKATSMPWRANSSRHHVRTNSPRSSPCGSGAISNAPFSAVSRKIMRAPVEVRVDLFGRQQVLQLAQPGEGRGIELALAHVDVLEEAAHLLGALARRPFATEARQDLPDLVEAHTVAAVVAGVTAELDAAVGECLADRLGDLADAIVVVVVADIQDLVAHRLTRRFQHGRNRGR